MKYLSSAAFFLLCILQITSAQTGQVTGTVYDKSNNKALPNVNVMLFPLGVGAVTDESGGYTLIEVPRGTYELAVSHVGYQKFSRKVIVHPAQTIQSDVSLAPKVELLEELTVQDQSQKVRPYRVDRIELKAIRKAVSPDIGTFLRETPNLSGIRKGGTNLDPVIRGFKFSQLNVQLNQGTRIEGGCPNRMDPATSHIDLLDVNDIRVYKGPYALRFGPNFGGIIRILTIRPGEYDKFETNVTAIQGFESNYNGLKGHLGVRGGNRFFFFNLTGNYNKYGDYTAGNSEVVSSRFSKYNYTAQLGFSPSKNQQFALSWEESFGRNVMFPALPMDERSDDTRIISFQYTGKQISRSIHSISFSAYRSGVDHVMDNKERPFSDTVVAVSTIRALNYGGRVEINYGFGKHNLWSGLDYEHVYKDGERVKSLILQPNMPVKKELLWDDAKIKNLGFFTEYNGTFAKVDIIGALRLDINDATSQSMETKNMAGQVIWSDPDVTSSFFNLSVSAGATWHVTTKIDLSLSLGHSTRSPDMVERFIVLLPIGYDNFDYLGDPQLKPEINNQIDITGTHNCERSGSFNLNGFFSLVQNYITGKEVPPSVVKPQTKGVDGVKQFYNADQVYLYGFELSYSTPEKYKLGATAVAAITAGINPTATKYIIQNGQVVGEEKVSNDPLPEIPPFESTVTVFYKFLKERLIPEFSIRMVAAQNHISQAYYEQKTSGFVLADFTVKFSFNKYLDITAGVKNIFNQAYYEHLNRNIVGSTQPLYEPGRVFYANLIFTI